MTDDRQTKNAASEGTSESPCSADPRDNPPEGYAYDCIVSPWQERDSGCTVTWFNGLGQEINVKGCILIPRRADRDGTCYLFTLISKPNTNMRLEERSAAE